MEMLALVAGGLLLVWWISVRQSRTTLASQVMGKWLETAHVAAAAADAGKGAALVGRCVSMSDFRYEYGGVPPMLKVSVWGTGAYLGFRGDIMDNGGGMIWVENGSRPAARKLVKKLC